MVGPNGLEPSTSPVSRMRSQPEVLKLRLSTAKGPFLFAQRGKEDKPLTTVRKHHFAAQRRQKFVQRFDCTIFGIRSGLVRRWQVWIWQP